MRIMVIGGYGNFGKRLVASLLKHYDHELVIGGRSRQRAEAFKTYCLENHDKCVETVQLDVLNSNLARIFSDSNPELVVNASGPFQSQAVGHRYRVARACIDLGLHYVDLADDRDFVCAFANSLDRAARDARVCLVTGASTVPGLSGAVLDYFEPRFERMEFLDYGISPGNRTERGEGTVASILSYTGRPFDTLIEGRRRRVYGWQNLRRYDFGAPVGKRWLGNCNIPDLELLPKAYPDLKTVRFQAGLEVTLLHLGLWLLSLPARVGIPRNWSRFARPLTRMSDCFRAWGSDSGAMFVEISGLDFDGAPRHVAWQLVAEAGSGPNIPTIAAELVIDKIARRTCPHGAMPCLGLFDLDQFLEMAARWGIYSREVNDV